MMDEFEELPIDILVNNAARVATIGYVHELSPDAWLGDLAVNLSAPFFLTSLVIEKMMRGRWGRIVNIGSIASEGLFRQSSYAASKAGLVGLTKTIALEYAAYGITANLVSPGLVASKAVIEMPKDIVEKALRNIPAGRLGELEDIAMAVRYLVSEQAGYVNGVVLPVDGGAACNQMRMVRGRSDPLVDPLD